MFQPEGTPISSAPSALVWVTIVTGASRIESTTSSPTERRMPPAPPKLRARAGLDIAVVPTGDATFADETTVDAHYALYEAVYAQSEIHFDRLSRAFFAAVLRDAGSGGLVFTYRRGGELIGFNLCYVVGDALVDKYIGLRYPQARECNLYFVSWVRNLEEACARGLRRYVAGWTGTSAARAFEQFSPRQRLDFLNKLDFANLPEPSAWQPAELASLFTSSACLETLRDNVNNLALIDRLAVALGPVYPALAQSTDVDRLEQLAHALHGAVDQPRHGFDLVVQALPIQVQVAPQPGQV